MKDPVTVKISEEQLQRLLSGLKRAQASFQSGARQEAAIQALGVTVDFINAWGLDEEPPLSAPLTNLMMGLADVRNGREHGLFKPAPPPNRPPDSTEVKGIKAIAAAAMQIFMDDGGGRADAATAVSNHLRTLDIRVPGSRGAITPTMVKNWRDALTGNAAPSLEREAYVHFLARAREMVQTQQVTLRQVAESLLDEVAPQPSRDAGAI